MKKFKFKFEFKFVFVVLTILAVAMTLSCESKKVKDCKKSCLDDGLRLKVSSTDINICSDLCVQEDGNWNAQDHYLKYRPGVRWD